MSEVTGESYTLRVSDELKSDGSPGALRFQTSKTGEKANSLAHALANAIAYMLQDANRFHTALTIVTEKLEKGEEL